MPDVTVVLSFKDNAGTILDCIRSVFAQSEDRWELVLLDDGSVDRGADLVAMVKDPRVTLIRHAENRGTPVRLNELTDRVHTPFLARMDGDDLMHPRRLELSLSVLRADHAVDVVAGNAVSIDAESRPTGLRRSVAEAEATLHLRQAPLIHGTVTGRTGWFAANRYDEGLRRCQDQELWVRTVDSRRTVVLDDVLLYLREAGTVPAEKYARSMGGTRRVIRRHGPTLVGRRASAKLVAETFAKQLVYRAAEPMGLVDRIVGRRAYELEPEALRAHAETLEAIRKVRLPGIDST